MMYIMNFFFKKRIRILTLYVSLVVMENVTVSDQIQIA